MSPGPDSAQTYRFAISEASAVGEVRRFVSKFADRLEFDPNQAGKLSIVVNELAGNLVKFAREGEILVRGVPDVGIELVAIDRGPGIADPAQCLRDGYSTAGSPGTGLGAVSRLSDVFDLHSAPGMGTAILSVVHGRKKRDESPSELPALGIVCVAAPGETIPGDAWAVECVNGRVAAMVADGLGHGPLAADAAREAVRVFRSDAFREPSEVVERAHRALAKTRGAAVAVAAIEPRRGKVAYCGVGNISSAILGGDQEKNLISHNGIVGHQRIRVQQVDYSWDRPSLIVMHSDGISTRWRLEAYPGLIRRRPELIAAVLYRDFKRGRDDATVLALRESA